MNFINMRKTYKYRIYPTISQISQLENTFSMCRHLYNWNLQERIEVYKQTGKSISYYDQQNALPALKKERPWFKSVYSMVLQDTLRRLDYAYKAFFRRVKNGNNPGFPKFKKRGQWNSITYSDFKSFPFENKIKVPKLGLIKIVYHRLIPKQAKIKTLIVSKEAGKWFACFSIELNQKIEPKQDLTSIVGIDLGLIDFLYPSTGEPVSAPRYLRKSETRLQKIQGKLSNAKKGSGRYYRILKALKKVHYKVKCQRTDFLHKTVNELLSYADLVVHEDLDIRAMVRRPKPIKDENSNGYLPNGAAVKTRLNKSINDVGWGKFLSILNYKVNEQGKGVVAVNPYMTSQKCSQCGEIVKKSLSTRTHLCPHCGYSANRDLNAANNILRFGLESLGFGLKRPHYSARLVKGVVT